jgi:hypothetical protein
MVLDLKISSIHWLDNENLQFTVSYKLLKPSFIREEQLIADNKYFAKLALR